MVISLTFKKKQTMKKIFVLMASAAVLFAACNKMEEVNTPIDTPVETETITVVLNPVTKTSLGENGSTTWSANDAVDVIYDDNKVGTLTHVGDSKFTGELTTVGLTGEVTLHYPAGVDAVPTTQTAVAGSFADDAAILEGKVDLDVLRAGEGTSLQNKTALLKFVMPENGEISFYNGADKMISLTGCLAGETYYACVNPGTYDLTYRVNTMESEKKKNASFGANKIYDLGTLPKFLRLLPNGTWNNSNPRYAAYFFTNGEIWKDMKSHTEGLYYVEVPEGQDDVIFCRMNPSATANNWDNKWNQTDDLTISGNGGKVYVVSTNDGTVWDKCTSSKWVTIK